MKKTLFPILMLALSFTACKTEKSKDKTSEETLEKEIEQPIANQEAKVIEMPTNATHKADLQNTIITWKGFKPGGSHEGNLNLKEGAVVYNGTLKSGVFVIDMASITATDIPKEDDDMYAKLIGHLSNEDFFDVVKYPTATFTFNEVENNMLKGDLTIKNITKQVAIPVQISEQDGVVNIKSTPVKIDRTEFGIKFKSKKFFDNLKDKFINDEFEVSFDIELKS